MNLMKKKKIVQYCDSKRLQGAGGAVARRTSCVLQILFQVQAGTNRAGKGERTNGITFLLNFLKSSLCPVSSSDSGRDRISRRGIR